VEAEEHSRDHLEGAVEVPVVRHSVEEVAGVEVEASHGVAARPVVVAVVEHEVEEEEDGDRKSSRVTKVSEYRYVTGLEPTD
jgi:hypothetical protein